MVTLEVSHGKFTCTQGRSYTWRAILKAEENWLGSTRDEAIGSAVRNSQDEISRFLSGDCLTQQLGAMRRSRDSLDVALCAECERTRNLRNRVRRLQRELKAAKGGGADG